VLSQPIYVTSIVIEHVDRTAAKNILSAPRDFQVIGYESMDALDLEFTEDHQFSEDAQDEERDGAVGLGAEEEEEEAEERAHLRGEHNSDSDSSVFGGVDFRRQFKELPGRSLLTYGTYGIHYSDERGSVQSFPVTDQKRMLTRIVKLNVLSNYGNDDFTCLYRFRVHGQPVAGGSARGGAE
jgi:SUN domain-containing protein 1/2